MKLTTLAIAAVAAIGTFAPAQAASYLLNYTGPGATAAITITTSDVPDAVGGYDILSASGNVNGDVLTGLIVNPNQPERL